jgi:HAD superfamily hydrolase (TIGR01509 family)
VLTDTAAVHAKAWKQVFDEFLAARRVAGQPQGGGKEQATSMQGDALRPFEVEDYDAYVDGRPREAGAAAFLASRGLSLPFGDPSDGPGLGTVCAIGAKKDALFLELLSKEGVKAFPDALELLEQVLSAGFAIAVVSSSANTSHVLRAAGLLEFFPVMIDGNLAKARGLKGKPAPDSYLEGAKELGISPKEAIVFEDALAGVQAGRAGDFGLVVGVDRHDQAKELLSSGADVAVKLLTQLSISKSESRLWDAVVAIGNGVGQALANTDKTASANEAAGSSDLASLVKLAKELTERYGVLLESGENPSELRAVSSRLWQAGVSRGRTLVVGVGPNGVSFLSNVVKGQLALRASMPMPRVDLLNGWHIIVEPSTPGGPRVHESLLSLADGRFGTRGSLEEDGPSSRPQMVAENLYTNSPQGLQELLSCPNWSLGIEWSKEFDADDSEDAGNIRRILDMRSALVLREGPGNIRTVRFVGSPEPGCAVLRARGDADGMEIGPPLSDPSTKVSAHTDPVVVSRRAISGGVVAAATQRVSLVGAAQQLDRVAGYVSDGNSLPDPEAAKTLLSRVQQTGFDRLLAEHRREWAARWATAHVSIGGDPELELAVRFGLFHLLASVAADGEAALGARGLSGPGYGGHVFWDADVFVLPCMAAIRPQAAKAMVAYRVNRLQSAREAAFGKGFEGARFPWESTREGIDVTPRHGVTPEGKTVEILTGDLEEHITADVAWAVSWLDRWSGDPDVLSKGGGELIVSTARYWASRLERDSDKSAHLRDVIGPDEYHVHVNDNAFTNMMARWNLRRAAHLVSEQPDLARGTSGAGDLRRCWLELADLVVDNFDEKTSLYEQFKGFFSLEPILISEIAHPPVAADILLGADRVSRSQVIKQADVLMAHHMIPEETMPGSLAANLDFYGPRCAHGSSLSPAIHARLLAKAGRPDEAVEFLSLASKVDLEDIGDTTAAGLHVASMGGAWQALAFGFMGLWPQGDHLRISPMIPRNWTHLELSMAYRGQKVSIRATAELLDLEVVSLQEGSQGTLGVLLGEDPVVHRVRGSARFVRGAQGWHRQRGGAHDK